MKQIIIRESDSGQRLDKFMFKYFPSIPKNLLYKYIRKKYIKVNGKKSDISYLIKTGDLVSLYIKSEFFEVDKDFDFLNAQSDLNILYEDENIILVDKKEGLVVHTDNSKSDDTLINRIKKYLYLKKEYDPSNQLSFPPSLCNRLDRNTSGIVICAKNSQSLRIINDKLKNKEIIKKYLCLVHGIPKPSSGVLSHYLARDKNLKKVFIHNSSVNAGKKIVTEYKTLGSKKGISLLEIGLVTGRTHQIRAHLNHIGHPLLGENKYVDCDKIRSDIKLKFQALCSYNIIFNFKSDAGILNYLRGKDIKLGDIWIKKFFYENI